MKEETTNIAANSLQPHEGGDSRDNLVKKVV